MNITRIIGLLLIAAGLIFGGKFAYDNFFGYEKTLNKANASISKIDAKKIAENKKMLAEKMKKEKEKADKKSKGGVELNEYGFNKNDPNLPASGYYGWQPDGTYAPFPEERADSFITYDASNVRSINTIPLDARINMNYAVGQIYVPSVHMHLAVMEGVNNQNLDVASGTMKPGQVMGKGNYAIAGHHMLDPDLLFTPLQRLKTGQAIFLTDGSKVYQYKTTDIFVVDPSQGQVIMDSEGDKLITLVTCSDAWGSARTIVRGELVKTMKGSRAPKNVRANFGF